MRIQDILAQCDVSIRYSLPDIEPNATHTILNKRTKDHIHFNIVECINNSGSNIELRLQPNDNILIPSKTSVSIQDKTISLIEIKNLSKDNTIRNDEISLSFYRWVR